MSSEEEVYIVEKIVTDRKYKGRKQYLIKWEGYPDSENSWVSPSDIYDKTLIQNYEKSKNQDKVKNHEKVKENKKEENRTLITNEWDLTVNEILCVQKGDDGLEAQISFKDGKILLIPISTVHQKCPLRLLEFYEKNINFVEVPED